MEWNWIYCYLCFSLSITQKVALVTKLAPRTATLVFLVFLFLPLAEFSLTSAIKH